MTNTKKTNKYSLDKNAQSSNQSTSIALSESSDSRSDKKISLKLAELIKHEIFDLDQPLIKQSSQKKLETYEKINVSNYNSEPIKKNYRSINEEKSFDPQFPLIQIFTNSSTILINVNKNVIIYNQQIIILKQQFQIDILDNYLDQNLFILGEEEKLETKIIVLKCLIEKQQQHNCFLQKLLQLKDQYLDQYSLMQNKLQNQIPKHDLFLTLQSLNEKTIQQTYQKFK